MAETEDTRPTLVQGGHRFVSRRDALASIFEDRSMPVIR
jgi:hypothetical protein